MLPACMLLQPRSALQLLQPAIHTCQLKVASEEFAVRANLCSVLWSWCTCAQPTMAALLSDVHVQLHASSGVSKSVLRDRIGYIKCESKLQARWHTL